MKGTAPGMSKNQRPANQRKGHLELARGRDDARTFMHLLMNFLHRADYYRRSIHCGDLDLAAVSETVGLAAIEHEARKADFIAKFGNYENRIGTEGQRPVNALTISQATGIPRETVRRKLKLLLERDVVVEKTRGGYVMKPGFIQTPENMDIVDRGMRDALQFMNDCMKLGLVRWNDETD
jgi:predicted transcriptional regulator